MRAATVVQQLCKSCRTCFKFYCKFYFTCDRSFTLSLFSCRSEMRWRSKSDIPVAQEHLHNERSWAIDVAYAFLQCIFQSLYRYTGWPIDHTVCWRRRADRRRWPWEVESCPDQRSCAYMSRTLIPVISQCCKTSLFCLATLCQLSASSIWDETCPDCVWVTPVPGLKSHSCTLT